MDAYQTLFPRSVLPRVCRSAFWAFIFFAAIALCPTYVKPLDENTKAVIEALDVARLLQSGLFSDAHRLLVWRPNLPARSKGNLQGELDIKGFTRT